MRRKTLAGVTAEALLIPLLAVLSCCFLLLHSQPSMASEITLQQEMDWEHALYQKAEWLIDKNQEFSAESLATAGDKFKPYDSFEHPLNPQRHPMWFRFTLHNPAQQYAEVVLTARESLSLSEVKLYKIEAGALPSKSAQKLPHQLTVYSIPITLAPGASSEYLVFWPNNIGRYPVETLRLMPSELFQQQTARHLALAYLTVGILFGLTLYNVCLYIFTRETSYVYYALYVAFAGIFFSMHDEIGHQLVSDLIFDPDHHGKILWWSILPGTLGLLLFSREFLETKTLLPSGDGVLKLLVAVLAFLIIFGFFIEHAVLRTSSILVAMVVFFTLLGFGAMIWRKGLRQARVYVLAFMALFTMALLASVAYVVEEDPAKAMMYMEFTRYGLIVSLMLLSIALADRINLIKQQQIKAEADSRAAKEAAELKGQFLASMSHEIRTPINGVIGMAQIIRDKAENKQDRKTADILLSSADTLLNVVNDILDFSKIEAGKLQLEKMNFELGLVFANVGALYYELNKNEAVKFIVDLDPGLPDFLAGDPLRLKQVMYNLLTNAFKFTEKGKVILSCQRLGERENNRQLIRFSVSDTGIGIDAREQQRLFNAYEQADKSSTRRYGGTGLGLSISKQLVELMGGEIGVSSTVGEGSEFWVTLSFDIDTKNEKLLQEQRKQLQGKNIAICYASTIYGKNEHDRLAYLGAKPTLHVIQKGSALPDLGEADVVVASDQIGPSLKTIIERCGAANIPMVVLRTNSGLFEDKWIELADIRLAYIPITAVDIESSLVMALSGKVLLNHGREQAEDREPLSEIRVLVAEDNKTNQLITRSMLTGLGQNITLVENGEQALNAYRVEQGKFDLILMDCEMPVMDGYEATRQIRRFETDNGLAPVLICAVTAHAMEENYQYCLDIGMDNVLIKPINLERLKSLIASLGSSGQSRSSHIRVGNRQPY